MASVVSDWPPLRSNSVYFEDLSDGMIKICLRVSGQKFNFNRKACEPAQRTLDRLTSSFHKKLCKKRSKKLAGKTSSGDRNRVKTLLLKASGEHLASGFTQNISVKEVLEQGHCTHMMVEGIVDSGGNSNHVFVIRINVPTLSNVGCHIKGSPVVSFPVAPYYSLSFASGCSWEWMVDDKLVGADPIFVPQPEHMDKKLSVRITPWLAKGNQLCKSDDGTPLEQFESILEFTYPIVALPHPLRPDMTPVPFVKRAQMELRASALGRRKPQSFRIMSYNILADVYTKLNPPSHLKTSPEVYSMEYRQNLILSEMLTCCCDIIALQECEHTFFEHFLRPQMRYHGFDGFFSIKRKRSKSKVSGVTSEGVEGCACFWQTNRLKLCNAAQILIADSARTNSNTMQKLQGKLECSGLTAESRVLESLLELGSVLQLCAFECVSNHDDTSTRKPQMLIIGNTHLYYHPAGEIVRAAQSFLVAKECQKFKESISGVSAETGLVIAGDFNATPETYTILGMRNGTLNRHDIERSYCDVAIECNADAGSCKGEVKTREGVAYSLSDVETETLDTAGKHKRGNLLVKWKVRDWDTIESAGNQDYDSKDTLLTHGLRLCSCYDRYLKEKAQCIPISTYTPEFEGTLDWIFYSSDSIAMAHLWQMYPRETLAQPAMPSLLFPSDHIPIVAEFRFKCNV